MSGEDKNRLDELFKKGLENASPDLNYHEPDWDDMEQLLDAGKKQRGAIYWLPRLGAVAALLLIFLGWWFFKPAAIKQQIAVKQPAHIPVITDKGSIAKSTGEKTIIGPEQENGNKKGWRSSSYAHVTHQPVKANVYPLKTLVDNVAVAERAAVATTGSVAVNTAPQKQISPLDSINNRGYLERNTIPLKDIKAVASLNMDSDQVKTPGPKETTDTKVKKNPVKGVGYKPQFGLTVLASPDINGVGSFQQSQVGANVGLLFSVSITPKLSVSTGASYSRKPYETNFSNYHTNYQFKTDPNNVYADCRVLDIPLNIDYKLYSKSRNSFSIGSGLSSYLMLKEQYSYNYDIPGSGPAGYTVRNRNQHILGVLNLNATYERSLNSKFSLAAEPYFKIPLTNIGSSQVRLRSAGVAVGFRWNINQSITP